jgi:hypothetical protein
MSEPLAAPNPFSEGQSDEPLGIKSPLLPPAPLGQSIIRRQFLVPLGARPIAILDPSIFLQRSDYDFPSDSFQETAFFPEWTSNLVDRSPAQTTVSQRTNDSDTQASESAVDLAIQPKLEHETSLLDATIQPKLDGLDDVQSISTVENGVVEFQNKTVSTTKSSIEPSSTISAKSESIEKTDFIQNPTIQPKLDGLQKTNDIQSISTVTDKLIESQEKTVSIAEPLIEPGLTISAKLENTNSIQSDSSIVRFSDDIEPPHLNLDQSNIQTQQERTNPIQPNSPSKMRC